MFYTQLNYLIYDLNDNVEQCKLKEHKTVRRPIRVFLLAACENQCN